MFGQWTSYVELENIQFVKITTIILVMMICRTTSKMMLLSMKIEHYFLEI